MALEESRQHRKLNSIINKYQTGYLILLIFGILFIILRALGIQGHFSIADTMNIAIGLIIFAIYIGLKGRKKWLILLILVFSVFVIIKQIFVLINPLPVNITNDEARNITLVILKSAHFLIIIFFLFQIKFFLKRDVKEIFGFKV